MHFKITFILIFWTVQGCATNDSNSLLVRFWNDGFIYNEKKMDDGQKCSGDANGKYPNLKPKDDTWLKYYENCMKDKGY